MAKKMQQSFQRIEKKYLLSPAQYRVLREGMAPYMKADEYGQYPICNIYYDTDTYALIRASFEKPVYKEKLRLRSYGTPAEDGEVFVEIKKKFDHVVYKRRIAMPCGEAVRCLSGGPCPENSGQIRREIDWFLNLYRPKPRVFIAYDRIALAGADNPELRVTFDTGLRWRDSALDLRLGDYGQPLLPEGQILMEIKIPGAAPLWLSRLLSENGVFPTSFSKYGLCYRENLLSRAAEAWTMPGPQLRGASCPPPWNSSQKEVPFRA